jgi:hypothetical protein
MRVATSASIPLADTAIHTVSFYRSRNNRDAVYTTLEKVVRRVSGVALLCWDQNLETAGVVLLGAWRVTLGFTMGSAYSIELLAEKRVVEVTPATYETRAFL